MSFAERRTTVLKESYQCKSLNILGTDLCVFVNDLNRKSRSIQKILVGDSRLGSIISSDKNGDIRQNLSDFETGSWRNQIRPNTTQCMVREGLIQNTFLLWVCNLGHLCVWDGNLCEEKCRQRPWEVPGERAAELSKADGELGMFGQPENGWERLWLFSMNLLVGVGKGAGDEKRTAGREKSCLNWRTMLAQE